MITGRSFGDVIAKIGLSIGDFSKDQWEAFKTDISEWKQKQKERKEEKEYKNN